MGRFSYSDADNYGSNGSSSYFSLKNDGDIASVRFMYNTMEDVEGYAVHQVEVDGKKRYVNCLRDYNEPKSKCPFCEDGRKQIAKLFIPLYDKDDGEVKVWERGKNFFAKMSALCARYAKDDVPLVSHTFDIERHGKPGDTSTTYETFETGCDNTRIEDLGELPEIIGTIVLDKTADDMIYYLDNEEFPDENRPARRNRRDEEPVRRRTPARRSNSDEDEF